MSDPKKSLAAKWKQQSRFSNFGPALRSVMIHGFRGICEMTITFESPITAITGLNGAGKSSVAQISLCAYKKPFKEKNCNRYYVRDFFPVSVVDPSPISDDARVAYRYETEHPLQPQDLTVSRATTEWSGYKRQPERRAYYVGFTVYIPKVERRDLSIYRASGITLGGRREIPDNVKKFFASIVGSAYDDVSFQDVKHKLQSAEIGIVSRFGHNYSENNMGFGEGRILYTIDMLESSPEKSLFVLEEPETSLHENAQHAFSKYLLDVCNRRGHQIILTTHSPTIVQALPQESSKLLVRDRDGVTCYSGLSSARVRAALSGGRQAALDIVVEDDFAKCVLQEAIRKSDRTLLQSVAIHPIGSADDVRDGVEILKKMGKKCVGVRDGDKNADAAQKLFKLPGSSPPEKEVFLNKQVQDALRSRYSIEVCDVLAANPDSDHHDWVEILSREAMTDPAHLSAVAADTYVTGIGVGSFVDLIDELKRSC